MKRMRFFGTLTVMCLVMVTMMCSSCSKSDDGGTSENSSASLVGKWTVTESYAVSAQGVTVEGIPVGSTANVMADGSLAVVVKAKAGDLNYNMKWRQNGSTLSIYYNTGSLYQECSLTLNGNTGTISGTDSKGYTFRYTFRRQ